MHRSNPIMHSIIVGWMGIELNKYLYVFIIILDLG